MQRVIRVGLMLGVLAVSIVAMLSLSGSSSRPDRVPAATGSAGAASLAAVAVAPSVHSAGARKLESLETPARAASASPADARARTVSTRAYRGLDGKAAIAVDQRIFPSVMNAAPWHGLLLGHGQRVRRYLGKREALVSYPDGHMGVAQSQVPLIGTTPKGASEPVNLALRSAGVALSPISATVPLQVPLSAQGSGQIGGTADVGVTMDGAAPSPARLVDGRAVMSNAYTDTDAIWQAVPQGLDLSYALRSPSSPHTVSVTLGLQPGDILRVVGPDDPFGYPSGSAEVDRDGKPLLWIPPPGAIDAQNQAIPSHYVVNGDELQIVIDDTGPVVWPIMLDPSVYEVWGENTNSPSLNGLGWGWTGSSPGGQWTGGRQIFCVSACV